MLVLSRRVDESITIGGQHGFPEITVKVIYHRGDRTGIGIEAPANCPVHRTEVFHRIAAEIEAAATWNAIQKGGAK